MQARETWTCRYVYILVPWGEKEITIKYRYSTVGTRIYSSVSPGGERERERVGGGGGGGVGDSYSAISEQKGFVGEGINGAYLQICMYDCGIHTYYYITPYSSLCVWYVHTVCRPDMTGRL